MEGDPKSRESHFMQPKIIDSNDYTKFTLPPLMKNDYKLTKINNIGDLPPVKVVLFSEQQQEIMKAKVSHLKSKRKGSKLLESASSRLG